MKVTVMFISKTNSLATLVNSYLGVFFKRMVGPFVA